MNLSTRFPPRGIGVASQNVKGEATMNLFIDLRSARLRSLGARNPKKFRAVRLNGASRFAPGVRIDDVCVRRFA